MLLQCIHVCKMWDQVCQWIPNIGDTEYNISDKRKGAGDMQNIYFSISLF